MTTLRRVRLSGVQPASEKSTTDNAIDREESRTPTYTIIIEKLYKWDTGAFPVPRDILRFSVNFTFRHIHTVPVCSSSADIIIYARVFVVFPWQPIVCLHH